MNPDINTLVINALRESNTLTTAAITKKILESFPELSKSAISWRLHKLKAEGLIQSPSYGTYSLLTKANFTPNLSSSVKRLYSRIQKEHPGIELCVWDSKWFNEFLSETQETSFIVAEVEKEFSEAVFNSLTDISKKIFFDPSAEILSRYILNLKDAIIIKPIISESPCSEIDNVRVALLEKLFVDSLAEPEMFAFLNDLKKDAILKNVIGKYNISISKMKRYSKRRNQHQNLSKLLSKLK